MGVVVQWVLLLLLVLVVVIFPTQPAGQQEPSRATVEVAPHQGSRTWYVAVRRTCPTFSAHSHRHPDQMQGTRWVLLAHTMRQITPAAELLGLGRTPPTAPQGPCSLCRPHAPQCPTPHAPLVRPPRCLRSPRVLVPPTPSSPPSVNAPCRRLPRSRRCPPAWCPCPCPDTCLTTRGCWTHWRT